MQSGILYQRHINLDIHFSNLKEYTLFLRTFQVFGGTREDAHLFSGNKGPLANILGNKGTKLILGKKEHGNFKITWETKPIIFREQGNIDSRWEGLISEKFLLLRRKLLAHRSCLQLQIRSDVSICRQPF